MPLFSDRFILRVSVVALAAAALMLLWQGLPYLVMRFSSHDGTPRTVSARGSLAEDERTTISLFENARGSVVFITTSAEVRDFWTRNVFTVPRGQGSGFVWDDTGHIITNFHVIQNATQAIVKLADGRDYRAGLVGASPAHDIAVLQIGVSFQRPPPVPLGTSADLKVGQKVFAIGNPFGLDWTLTTGIVSALDRSLGEGPGRTIEHLIQTDAAINPGNSGGPLLDSAGRLIGINTAIYSPSGASAGISFAVPVDTVNHVVPQLIKNGRYIRPGLGIVMDDKLNRRMQQALKFEGVAILRVQPGSTAAKAGLRPATVTADGRIMPGDVISAIGGKPVTTVQGLLSALEQFKVGETVKLDILRKGEPAQVEVTLQPDA